MPATIQSPRPYCHRSCTSLHGYGHVGDPLPWHDPALDQRRPERPHVADRRVDPSVARPANGQVKHVRPCALGEEIAERRACRQLVRAEECRVLETSRLAHALPHEVVVRHAARALGDEREHDEAAVAVGEVRACGELRRVAVEDPHVVLGPEECVHGNREDVVGDLELVVVLVEVVADPGAMGKQMLDRDVVGDEGKVVSEHGACGRVEREHAVLDEAHHRERGHALETARGRELRLGCVRRSRVTAREPVAALDDDLVPAVDPDGSREARLLGDRVDIALEVGHRADATRRCVRGARRAP